MSSALEYRTTDKGNGKKFVLILQVVEVVLKVQWLSIDIMRGKISGNRETSLTHKKTPGFIP